MATRLAAEGMHVVIADIEAPVLEATADELGVVGVRTDVADADRALPLRDTVLDRFGAVHVVCNNAGVGGPGQIKDLTLKDWKWVIDVSLWGVIHGIHAFLPQLLANEDGGHIVNTASVAGLVSSPRSSARRTRRSTAWWPSVRRSRWSWPPRARRSA